MEEVRWDREAFVQQQQQRAGGSGSGASLGGVVLFIITLGILGGGVYWYLTTQGLARELPQISLPLIGNSKSADLAKRFDELDARLAQIEKRLNIPPAPKANTSSASSARPTQRATAPRPAASASQGSSRPAGSGPVSTTPLAAASAPAGGPDPEMMATREAWEATTDRLGMAVGQLGDQRREIARTQEDLDQLRKNLERSYVPFQLSKAGGRQRVGPVWLELQTTDRRNQRYSMRLQFDDRTVQMKDRVLGERVAFFISAVDGPLELVVSDIQQDHVSGQLALPASGSDPSQ
jgi:hypothetical protein